MADKDKQDTVYDTRALSKWFALGSIALLVVVVWASIQDYARPWKVYQRQFQRISAAVGERKLVQADKALNEAKLKELEKQIADAQAKMAVVTEDIDRKISKDLWRAAHAIRRHRRPERCPSRLQRRRGSRRRGAEQR